MGAALVLDTAAADPDSRKDSANPIFWLFFAILCVPNEVGDDSWYVNKSADKT